jgi:hypothetical protein
MNKQEKINATLDELHHLVATDYGNVEEVVHTAIALLVGSRFQFSELSESAQQNVLDNHSDLEYGDDDPYTYWYESIYTFYANGERYSR